jgi:hypothetical protein
MNCFSYSEIRLFIANSTSNNNIYIPYIKPYLKSKVNKPKYLCHRLNLIKTLKTYVKKYCSNEDKYNILYLSILYLDIILSKNKISLAYDKNLKYLCLCCFLISLKFIGNYNISRKVISNFCNNYREEYKIFEMQCLILLDYNLVYTTAYNYLNMILIKEPKKLLSICNSFLYQICEDNSYIYYSPFYVSVAIFKLAKISINDNHHNHYDKYFQDERVRHLLKKFNYIINPSMAKYPLMSERYIVNDNMNNTITNTTRGINIITNSNIHNNILIISGIPKKRSDKNFDLNETFFLNKTPIKLNMKGNFKQKKMFETLNKDSDENDFNEDKYDKYKYDNYNYNFNRGNKIIIQYRNNINKSNNYHNKINSTFVSKPNNLSNKSYYSLCRIKSNNNRYNNHKMVTIRQGDKRQNEKIISYITNSSNSLSYRKSLPKKKYEKNSADCKKNIFINKSSNKDKTKFKEESLSTDIQTPNHISSSIRNAKKKKIIMINKNSVDFQLASGVQKEKLVKISRNLSQKPSKMSK